jgi:hypothetical protein
MIWLLGLPQWLALLVVAGGLVVLSSLAFLVVHRRWPAARRRRHNDVAGFIFAVAGVMYGVLLGFVVVILWQQFSDAAAATNHEAAVALTLQHELGTGAGADTTGDAARQGALTALHQYAEVVLSEEFPQLATGVVPPAGTPQLTALWTATSGAAVHDDTLTRARDLLDDLEEARALRLSDARNTLPAAVWLAIWLGAGLTVGFGCLFGAESALVQAVMVAALAGLIGMLVYVAIELDHPFTGRVAVDPAGFRQILDAPVR